MSGPYHDPFGARHPSPLPGQSTGQSHATKAPTGAYGYQSQSTNPPKRWNTCLLVGLILSAVFGTCMLCMCGGAYVFFVPRDVPVTPRDQAMMVDAQALQDYIAFDSSVGEETIDKSRYFDGSVEIDYFYEEPTDEGLVIGFNVGVEKSESDAKTQYAVNWEAIKLGVKLLSDGAEVQFDEHNEIFSWGDQSRFVILTSEGIPFGNVFMARKGNKIVTFILGNAYFDDQTFAELLLPKLSLVDEYTLER